MRNDRPQLLGASMKPTSPSGHESSAEPPAAERRLDDAYRAYAARLMQERPGWYPAATAQARAAVWGRFALWCDELLKGSGVPPIFAGVEIEPVAADMPAGYHALAAELVGMLGTPKLVAVGGPRGTGKTMLASGLIRLFCQCGRPAVYRTTKAVMDELSGAPWEQKDRIRASHRRPDLLVLDEVQVRDDRSWQDNELTELIDVRYRDAKATVLISNLEAAPLKANLGDSIWRRMLETGGLPFETNWPRLADHFKALREERRPHLKPPASPAA